jgi:hypothetical protein
MEFFLNESKRSSTLSEAKRSLIELIFLSRDFFLCSGETSNSSSSCTGVIVVSGSLYYYPFLIL